jgi:NADPH:quinone reductase
VRAVEISRHGGPDELVVVERADPVPAPGQVPVRNRWIGVNFVDLQHREGRPYPVPLWCLGTTGSSGRGLPAHRVVVLGVGGSSPLAHPIVYTG